MVKNIEGFQEFLTVLGQNIKKERKKSNLSQEMLAFEIDSARNYIGCIERAEKTLSLKTLYKISKFLDIPIEQLLKDTMKYSK